MDAKEELEELRIKYNTFSKKECDEETSKKYDKMLDGKHPEGILPEDVEYEFDYDNQRYKYYYGSQSELNKDEIQEFIGYKTIKLLTTIKNCVLFFTICTVIGAICFIISLLSL